MTLTWGDTFLNNIYLLSEYFLSERVVEYRLFDIYILHINVTLKGVNVTVITAIGYGHEEHGLLEY
jgi:hypothetical protein